MGFKESSSIQLEVIRKLGDNPDGMCVPMAIMESLPDGLPTRKERVEIIDKIIGLLSKKEKLSADDFWTEVTSYFWPGKSVADLNFRGANDPELMTILNYVYEYDLPIIACITEPNHAIGLHFISKRKYGVVLEFVYGQKGERPFIPLKDPKFHDPHGLLAGRFGDDSIFAIFPSVDELG